MPLRYLTNYSLSRLFQHEDRSKVLEKMAKTFDINLVEISEFH